MAKSSGKLYWGKGPLAETDASGHITSEYIFLNGQRIARRDADGSVHYYFSDHLGSHSVIENATGTKCEQDMDYYPYGGVANDYCSSTSVPQNYKFTGKERDPETGLDMFGARYYASSLLWQNHESGFLSRRPCLKRNLPPAFIHAHQPRLAEKIEAITAPAPVLRLRH